MEPTGVLLVGCGKMGGALLRGWQRISIGRIAIVDPALRTWSPDMPVYDDASAVPADWAPDFVIFAVKPQMMDATAPAYRRQVAAGAAVLSIAAGKSLAAYAGYFGGDAEIVRAMPNLPAAIGRGITLAVGNNRLTDKARARADALLGAVGEIAWTDDESLLDAATAVSGSGPAYVFLLIEAMTSAGIKAGLPSALAASLARATVSGAGELARQSTEDAASLRRNVTSPNGTTAAALDILMAEDGLQTLFDRAIASAAKRSRELAS